MIYARSLNKGDAVEQARLRSSPNESLYVVQFATNQINEGPAEPLMDQYTKENDSIVEFMKTHFYN